MALQQKLPRNDQKTSETKTSLLFSQKKAKKNQKGQTLSKEVQNLSKPTCSEKLFQPWAVTSKMETYKNTNTPAHKTFTGLLFKLNLFLE